LREARANFLWRGLYIGAAALVASMGVLAVIAFAITRHLARLAFATKRVAEGDLDAMVQVTTRDEIGLLGASFNAMALALKSRVAALEASETQQRLHLNVAREEKSRLTTLLGAMQSGIVFVDAEARVIYEHASFARIWSISEPAEGQTLSEIVALLTLRTDSASTAHLNAILSDDTGDSAARRELHTLDGRVIIQRMQPVANVGEGGGCILFYADVTLDRQTQRRAHEALHDPLTGLLNRRGLYESLQAAIVHAEASRTPLVLMYIDLDDFKNANDVGGPPYRRRNPRERLAHTDRADA
jgi:nitrogen fixation/metabolism regulation signal transduction histidine kinase